jgi:PhnB protein
VAKKTNPVPAGYTAITPYLRIKGAREAIAFYKAAFGATVDVIIDMGPQIGHCELTIGGAKIALADEFPEMGIIGPKTIGKTSVTIMHYCKDTDAVIASAVKAGAKVLEPAADQFWGARMGQVEDPFGHVWMIQTQIEVVSDREMQRRMEALMAQHKAEPAKPAAKKKAAAKT